MKRESAMSTRRATVRKAGLADYKAKRLQIIGAAADIFKDKGFQATNINEIAAAAGIDRATFYYYAASKKELFHEVVGEAVRDNVLRVEQIANGPGEPAEKLRRFVSGLMQSYHTHYPYLFVFIQEDMTKIGTENTKWSKEMLCLEKRFDDALTSIVQQGINTGAFTIASDARLAAFGIVGMLNWSHRWYQTTGGYTADQIGTAFGEMIINGLRGQHKR